MAENVTPAFGFRWDVFLSFRGEDTRDGFTDRLYAALLAQGIRAFLDNEGLSKGDEIASTLIDAIHDSAAAIAIVSPSYASSRWCLEELATICDCRRLLVPVFFLVDPSDVRRQRGPFEEDFRMLERRFGVEKVARWRDAMETAGGKSGWMYQDSNEPELIQLLVRRILTELRNTHLRRTYDLHQQFFSISQGKLSFEEYYARFRRIRDELRVCEPLSSDIQVVRRQRERMEVARFLSGVSSDFDPVSNQILGSSDLPSLSEVFSRLRQSSASRSTPPPASSSDRSALASAVSSGFGSGNGRNSRGRGSGGRGSSYSSSSRGTSGFNGRSSSRNGGNYGRTSGGGGLGSYSRGRGTRSCTHCGGTSHMVDYCYKLHGYPQAHQVATFEETVPSHHSTDQPVTISAEEYQRFVAFQQSSAGSSSTATLAQTGSSVASSSTSIPWVIDSGASDHMTGSKDGEED